MTLKCELAIVGAGPAGAALAVAASRAGLSTIVIDAAKFPRQKVCGEYLTAAAWRLLDELGLDELRAQAVPLPTMELAADDACRASLSFGDRGEAPRALSRHVFDAQLVDQAARLGATVLTGRRVRRVVVESGRAVALECGGDDEHAPGELIAAKLIVAADGRHSVVVRDTGTLVKRGVELVGFKRHVRPTSGAAARVIALHALPGGYFGTCPTEDGALNVCGVLPRRLVKQARGNVAAALDAWLVHRPALHAAVAAEPDGGDVWHSMPDVLQQSARPTVAGVLYVGDAHGTIEPLTGQGMTMALESARLALATIERFGVDRIDAAAQGAYAAAWHAAFDRPIRAAAWFGRLLRRPRLLKALLVAGRPLPRLMESVLRGAHRRTIAVRA